jgi:two-component system, cell cycle response regulator
VRAPTDTDSDTPLTCTTATRVGDGNLAERTRNDLSQVERATAADREVVDLLETGRADEANELFDKVVRRPLAATADRNSRACTLVSRAVTAWRLGRTPLALELAAEGWTELDAGPVEGADAAQALGRLGYLLDMVGRRSEALQITRRSVSVAREAADRDTLAHCLQRLGGGLNIIAMDADHPHRRTLFGEAKRHLEEGLQLATEPRVRRALLGALARSCAGLAELDRAEELAEQTVRSSSEAQWQWGVCVGQWVLADVCRQRGHSTRSRELLLEAARLAEKIRDPIILQAIGLDLAAVARQLVDPATEVAALRYVVAAARRTTDTLREGLGQALEQRRFAVRAQRLAAAAQRAAARDPLTGLANRLGLEQTAPVLINAAVTTGRAPWLVLVDVDHFKTINDLAGHPAGDHVLREIAELLRRECRVGDVLARWAGDEFIVLLAASPSERPDSGIVVAERIRSAVDGFDWSMTAVAELRPTVSVGVAGGSTDLDSLFTAADAALYQAKRRGRNRVEVFRGPGTAEPGPLASNI